jgi:uncharacterized protein
MQARKRLIPIFLTSLIGCSGTALAGEIKMVDSGGLFTVHVTSLKEMRFKRTIQQEHDFSCGSAALATLLTYHYEHPVTEEEVFKAMFEHGNKNKIEQEGFSLLDMKRYLEANGYRADGYKDTSLDKVRQVGIPVIVLINNGGYMHFVVIKGVDDGQVLIGDPATGSRTVPREEFDKIWNHLVFVINGYQQIATNQFNTGADWKVRETSPLGAALSRDSLGAYSLLIPPGVDALANQPF